MRVLALVILLLSTSAFADDWSEDDTRREIIYTSLLFIDYQQTLAIERHPELAEGNPLLGRHPSNTRISLHFLTMMTAQYYMVKELSPEYRKWVQWFGITFEAGVGAHNASLGLSINF